jgi:phosphonate transport system substrate-binding protein
MNTEDRKHGGALLLLIPAVVVCMVAIAVAMWVVLIQRPKAESVQKQQELMLRLTGLSQPVKNKLGAGFRDEDGDLLADAPKDPSEFQDPPVLYFSYVAVEEPESFRVAFGDLLSHLSRVTGRPVEYLPVTSTEDQLRAMRDGKLHIAGFNTGNVPIAVNVAGFVPFATMADKDGKSQIQMELIVRADSNLRSASDLKLPDASGARRQLALTEPGSNTGYRAPLVLLAKEFDVLPERDYLIRYSGGHDQSIEGIASGRFEVAAVASDVLARAVGAGTIKPEQYRSIYRSGGFPPAGFGTVYNLRADLVESIRKGMLEFDWSNTSLEGYFAQAGQVRFVPVSFKDDFGLVRELDDRIGHAHELRDPAPATTAPGAEPETTPSSSPG